MQIKNYPEQKDIQRAAMEDACLSYQLYPDFIFVQEKEKGIGLIDLWKNLSNVNFNVVQWAFDFCTVRNFCPVHFLKHYIIERHTVCFGKLLLVWLEQWF